MPIYTVKLIQKRDIARNTIELTFEKPAGMQYTPGQYGGFTLINPPETDASGNTRRFSLLSAPHQDHISIATRLQTSAYKRVLSQFNPGDVIKFAGPTGNFVLHTEATTPAVLIAGGIGIAPFYSMIQHAVQHASSQPIYLFYGNQTEEDACYLQELQQWQAQHPALHFIPVLAKPTAEWSGETGFITDTILKKYITDLSSPIYYICGSPAMVTTLQETLMEMGIEADKIKIEDFPGY